MKKLKIVFLFILLMLAYIYACQIHAIPSSMILFEGEELRLKTPLGMQVKKQGNYASLQTSSELGKKQQSIQKESYEVELWNTIPVKKVMVNVIPKTEVIPLGSTIGLKLYTDGVLVVGKTEVKDIQHKEVKPYENCNIKEGDRIVAIDDKSIHCTTDLVENVNISKGKALKVQYVNEKNESFTEEMTPVQVAKQQYKLGLWVRDTAAGVGTITYYEPATKNFGALGHGIMDIDTEELIEIAKGEVTTAHVVSILKGKKGSPGEMKGTLSNQSTIGSIAKNTRLGIFGKLNNTSLLNETCMPQKIPVALREEIQEGKASLMCSLENGQTKEYEIEIEKMFRNNNENNKSMIIKVVDPELLEKTGGIIQRYEWKSYYPKWKICRSCNTCVGE